MQQKFPSHGGGKYVVQKINRYISGLVIRKWINKVELIKWTGKPKNVKSKLFGWNYFKKSINN